MKNSNIIKQQKKSFRSILKNVKQSRFADFTGLSSLDESEQFTELYSKYTELVDVMNHEQLMTILRRITNNSTANDVDLFNTDDLISKDKFDNFAFTRRGYLRPLDNASLKQLDVIEDYIRYVYKQYRVKFKPSDKIFYMFDNASIQYYNGSDIADLRALQLANSPWYRPKQLPVLKDILPAGQSHNQCLHAMLDQLEKHGAQVTTLVASARQIVELGLLYSQRRGEFATFKNLLPNLKIWVNDTGFYSVNEKLIESVFVGLDVKKVDIYNSITGALAIQDDVKQPGILTLQTDLDVFYEFIPIEFVDNRGKILQGAKRFHAGNVEVNKDYVLAVSNKSGLISITTSDVVKVVSTKPLKIVYLRRAQSLNTAKENLHTHLINRIVTAINTALEGYHIVVRDYMVGYDSIEKRHIWAVELSKSPELIDEKILASIVNRIHKMLLQNSKMYQRAIDSNELQPPRMYILPLGGLAIFEKPKGAYGIDLTEDASIVTKYAENNTHRVFQAANLRAIV
tara:strand:- start:11008 stop:12546 length:1539 start_codon:yes stop_codon:yes gene_type:complete